MGMSVSFLECDDELGSQVCKSVTSAQNGSGMFLHVVPIHAMHWELTVSVTSCGVASTTTLFVSNINSYYSIDNE